MAGAIDSIRGTIGGAVRGVKVGQLGSLADLPFNLKVLVEAGIVRPMGPGELLSVGQALRALGRFAGGRDRLQRGAAAPTTSP